MPAPKDPLKTAFAPSWPQKRPWRDPGGALVAEMAGQAGLAALAGQSRP